MRDDRFLILTVGGIEPRKGTDHLFRALSMLRRRWPEPPVLAIIGGHSFQDHTPYRDRVIASMAGLDLEFDRDVALVGTVPDDEMAAWYHAADAFAFPSTNEGFGLAVLEAMAAGLPVVLTDLPVFAEYLRFGVDALAVTPGDDEALAGRVEATARNDGVKAMPVVNVGRDVAARFDWDATARQHVAVYDELETQLTGAGAVDTSRREVEAIEVPVAAWLAASVGLSFCTWCCRRTAPCSPSGWNTIHEFFHDGRHFLGVPCH